jgi:hypothetical protein
MRMSERIRSRAAWISESWIMMDRAMTHQATTGAQPSYSAGYQARCVSV